MPNVWHLVPSVVRGRVVSWQMRLLPLTRTHSSYADTRCDAAISLLLAGYKVVMRMVALVLPPPPYLLYPPSPPLLAS